MRCSTGWDGALSLGTADGQRSSLFFAREGRCRSGAENAVNETTQSRSTRGGVNGERALIQFICTIDLANEGAVVGEANLKVAQIDHRGAPYPSYRRRAVVVAARRVDRHSSKDTLRLLGQGEHREYHLVGD